ncbi:MAG: flagellar assembly protein FliW [Microthrixaceae bacterium]
MTALIETSRFGDLEFEEHETIRFPDGLLGFEDEHSFVVVPAGEDGVYSWLQSTATPEVAFLVTTPQVFFPDYAPEVPDDTVADLSLGDGTAAVLLSIVTVGERSVSANLLGPLVLNTATRTARQVVLSDGSFSTRHPLC